MTLEKNNFTRNQKADESRIDFWGSKPTFLKIFSSDEYSVLWKFLKPRYFLILLLIAASFILATFESLKTVSFIGAIKGLLTPEADLADLLKFSISGIEFNLALFINDITRVNVMILIFAALSLIIIIGGIGKLITSWLSTKIKLDLMRQVRKETIDKLFTFDLEYFNQARSGELIFLISSETSRFSNIINNVSTFINTCFQLLIYLIILFYLYWDITLIAVISFILYFLLHINIDYPLKQKSWEGNLSLNRLAHVFHQIIYGIKMIKIGSMEKREQKAYLDEHSIFEKQTLGITILTGLSMLFQDLLMFIIILFTGIYIYFFKDFQSYLSSPDELLAYLFLLFRVLPVGSQLQQARNNIISAYGPWARVIELLKTEDGPHKLLVEGNSKNNLIPEIDRIAVKNLSFSYQNGNQVLRDIDLEFKRGSMTALVGFSGSGKSTLLDILSVVRSPESGKMLINNTSIDDFNPTFYKKTVGYMNQEPIIFHDTVNANIKFFKQDASEKEIWNAMNLAVIDKFIEQLSDGLNTGLGERGLSVSGGERQRIGLARVFLQDTQVLLLDEATNALDYETEFKVYQNLEKIIKDKIVIVAAHRLSALKNFDQIIVFHDGRIVERGTFNELTKNQSYFYNLYTIQEQESI